MNRPSPRERLARLLEDLRGIDARVAVVLLTSAAALTFLEFGPIRHAFGGPGAPRKEPPGLDELTHWGIGCLIAYLAVPAIVVVAGFRERLSDWGLNLRGFVRHLPVYLILYLVVAPVVVGAFALFPETARVYPFYRGAREGLEPFLRWQLVYGLQFLSLEFFFRGFLLFGLERRFGMHAILVMVVPYCMIHFRKTWRQQVPLPSTGMPLLRVRASWHEVGRHRDSSRWNL